MKLLALTVLAVLVEQAMLEELACAGNAGGALLAAAHGLNISLLLGNQLPSTSRC